MSNSLRPHGLLSSRLLGPWDSPSKNTGVGCHALLKGIFLTQGLNLGLLHCRQILYLQSFQGSPIGCLRAQFKTGWRQSPGKEARGCWKWRFSCSVMSDSLGPHGLLPTRLLCPLDSPGKNTGVGSHSLLQGFFLTQGLNLGLLHCRQILYHLSH